MPRHRSSPDQNVLLFPAPELPGGSAVGLAAGFEGLSQTSVKATPGVKSVAGTNCEVVISGTYRKGFETLKRAYEEFRDLGCTILSPSNVSAVREDDGFVYMQGEEAETPERIERKHLFAIQKANFVWLHAPDGYVGPTAALEIGFANAAGVPVYATELPTDRILQSFVQTVDSIPGLVAAPRTQSEPPAPALQAFQEYYRRAAVQRGYTQEGPKDCLLLMVEEVGELARALRKREKLVRHSAYAGSDEAHELADVFLYVVHMANILGLDLAGIVRDKESINLEKWLAR